MVNQPNNETLKFRIGLSGTFWANRPKFSVLINDTKVASGVIEGDSDVVQYIEFNHDVFDGATNQLKIRLENKLLGDTVENADKTEIVKDMLLNIVSIEIDEISLGYMLWTESKYIADDPEREPITHCINLGWNGTYSIEFTSPFYLWLLESM